MKNQVIRWTFQLQAKLAGHYPGPMATGENLFSLQDGTKSHTLRALRPNRDILQFDCALSYDWSSTCEYWDC